MIIAIGNYISNRRRRAAGKSYLLDVISDAKFATSQTKLKADNIYYSQIRRDNDNDEVLVGFDSSDNFSLNSPCYDADTQAPVGLLSTFIGNNDGYVSKLVDLSGNGNDAIQASASAQPKLISNGEILTAFACNNDYLTVFGAGEFSFGDDDFTIYTNVAAQNDNIVNFYYGGRLNGLNYNYIFGSIDSGFYGSSGYKASAFYTVNSTGIGQETATVSDNAIMSDNGLHKIVNIRKRIDANDKYSMYVDGSKQELTDVSSRNIVYPHRTFGTFAGLGYLLGASSDLGVCNAYIASHIVFNRALTAEEIVHL